MSFLERLLGERAPQFAVKAAQAAEAAKEPRAFPRASAPISVPEPDERQELLALLAELIGEALA